MIIIRYAMETDLENILSIYNDIIVNTTAVYDYEPHTIEMRRNWYQAKQKDGYPVFVATENGKIVGFSSIGRSAHGLPISIRWKTRYMWQRRKGAEVLVNYYYRR